MSRPAKEDWSDALDPSLSPSRKHAEPRRTSLPCAFLSVAHTICLPERSWPGWPSRRCRSARTGRSARQYCDRGPRERDRRPRQRSRRACIQPIRLRARRRPAYSSAARRSWSSSPGRGSWLPGPVPVPDRRLFPSNDCLRLVSCLAAILRPSGGAAGQRRLGLDRHRHGVFPLCWSYILTNSAWGDERCGRRRKHVLTIEDERIEPALMVGRLSRCRSHAGWKRACSRDALLTAEYAPPSAEPGKRQEERPRRCRSAGSRASAALPCLSRPPRMGLVGEREYSAATCGPRPG